ncbi:LPS export ABC transporter permease LptF [Oceanicoccus sp. KOV_DT_Chl]|uniref:LPS export ABC transporter permease LptF n=1 Tax=Oceanicoccus sp. KOV_DT_Chl TaxID=1904639 RepID=UPI000C7C6B19|nr:LPS export ABC transporter permease LptF [Oceanicoccus sp. KOV_DT_Chl]
MILFRYLTKEILVSMFAVSVTLLVIVMSGRFVKYLAQAAAGELAPDVVLTIMMYRVPSFLELVLPLGLFIGILLAYGRLYVESEMTVMSACGMSTKRLALFTLAPSILVAAVVGYMSLYASPIGMGKAQDIFKDADNASGLELLVAGRFRIDEKEGRVSYIEQLNNRENTMREVFSASQTGDKNGEQLSIVFAEKAAIEIDEATLGRYLVLENGYQYIGAPGQLNFRVTHFEKFGQLVKEPERQRSSYKRTDARTTEQLLTSDKLEDKATLQWRISLIILVPIIALIAQALSKTNHRKGRYVKMLPAFLIYIFYLVGLNAARDAIEKQQLPLELGMWWVHGVFLLIALLLLFGQDAYRRLRNLNSPPVRTA